MEETITTAQTTEPSTSPQTQESTKAEQTDPNSEKLSTYETALRKIFNVAEGEELGDIDGRISTFEAEREQLLTVAKDKVITASLNALEGYNSKLLARLIDRNKITVDENGNISGLEEAAKAVAEEFPDVLIKKSKPPFVPSNPAQQTTTTQTMNDLIRKGHR